MIFMPGLKKAILIKKDFLMWENIGKSILKLQSSYLYLCLSKGLFFSLLMTYQH